MKFERRRTKVIKIGKVAIGGNNPVRVQSMTKTFTTDVQTTVHQIERLEKLGCEIIRVAVPDEDSAKVLGKIKAKINIPLVADIHFDWRLALLAIEQGVDKIRINPGNIDKKYLPPIIRAAKKRKIPVRLGINAGSLKTHLAKERVHKIDFMVKTLLDYIKYFESFDFRDLVISLKASDVTETIEAYRRVAKVLDYPLHLGITEAGPPPTGTIKSAVGIGTLLAEGIGDTIRVSLTASPEEEVKVGYQILQMLGLRNYGFDLISCPTCGRCQINLVKIVKDLETQLSTLYSPLLTPPLKVAVMGCIVNGPGEAREADVGIAGAKGIGLLFKKGKIIRKVPEEGLVKILIAEIKKLYQT